MTDTRPQHGQPSPNELEQQIHRLQEEVAAEHDRAENLAIALATSRQIGTALGILMAQHGVTQEQAFELLRCASQRTNRKLRDVAEDVVLTGTLDPGPASSSSA